MAGQTGGRSRDRGAASLETTGMIAAAALVAGSLLAVMLGAAPQVESGARYAVCVILGRTDCGAAPDAIDPHRPPQPCVVATSSGAIRREIAVAVFVARDGRTFEVAELSDGSYRVTLVKEGSAGAGVGVGGGVTVIVDDRGGGFNASADATASLQVQGGSTWYLPDAESVRRLMSEEAEDTIEDTVLGDGGPFRSVWELGQDAVGAITGNGDYEFPEPDETFAQGGLVLTASAEADFAADRAGAFLGITEAAGVRTAKDGGTTVYLRTRVDARTAVQLLDTGPGEVSFRGGRADGTLELLTAVSFDSSGAMTQVSTTATAAGLSAGVVNALFGGSGDPDLSRTVSAAGTYQATLPIRSAADRDTAIAFLAATGAQQVGVLPLATAVPATLATSQFVSAAKDHGYVTRQSFSTDPHVVFAAGAAGKVVIGLGASVRVISDATTSTSAVYWNGRAWTGWTGCTV